VDPKQRLTGSRDRAVGDARDRLDLERLVDTPEDLARNRQAADRQLLSRLDSGPTLALGIDHELTGQIPVTDVFGQREIE
jgi:hypothetical protein